MNKGKKLKVATFVTTLVLCTFLGLTSCLAQPSGNLLIYHADSLTKPLRAMIQKFGTMYPNVRIVTKGAGSTGIARLISEGGQTPDIMASADYKVIDSFLIPDHADWNIRFASNQMVLCYTDKSKFSSEVNESNWFEILQKDGVRWGHSDPNQDPCGYRSFMVMQLAENYYGVENLYLQLLATRSRAQVKDKATELVQMLRAGELDYGWEYLSVAVQNGLKYVLLDDIINLGNYNHDDFYSSAWVQIAGKKKGTWIRKKGKSITYGVTILKNSSNPVAAEAFVRFLISPDLGFSILQDYGQPPFAMARVSTMKMKNRLPSRLQPLVQIR